MVEIKVKNTWHSYLTSVLDSEVLPPYVVADLYRKRWRIEEAFNTVKRLRLLYQNQYELELITRKTIAFLNINQQDNGDRTFNTQNYRSFKA